jgi:single-strand DNA-binding protein
MNRYSGMGNLTKDAVGKRVKGDMLVVNFTIAINDMDTVTYIDAEVWGKKAEYCLPQLKKGKPVLIDGKMRYNSWKTKDNQTRSRLYCLVDYIKLLKYDLKDNTETKPNKVGTEKPKDDSVFIEDDAEDYAQMEDIPF